jgi:hypothetical protein
VPSTINIPTFPPTTIVKEIKFQPSSEIISENIIYPNNNNEKNCTVEEIMHNKCSDGQITLDQLEEIKQNLLYSDYSGENTIIETETVIIQLSTLDEQFEQENENVSSIDFGVCEDTLRSVNNIDDDEDLIVYKTDIKSSDLSSTYVVYEVYDSSLNKLNLDVCSEIQISILVPIKLDESLDSLAKSLSDS